MTLAGCGSRKAGGAGTLPCASAAGDMCSLQLDGMMDLVRAGAKTTCFLFTGDLFLRLVSVYFFIDHSLIHT